MPIYEYRCRGCGEDFEQYVHSASTAVACPTCASGEVSASSPCSGSGPTAAPSPRRYRRAGGCCGGGCACH